MSESKLGRLARLGQTFTPHSPVSEVDLFSGRSDQIMAVATTVGQPGRQIAVFGERGVGKTSFASLINRLIPGISSMQSYRINCGTNDDFGSLWRRVWKEMGAELPDDDDWRRGDPDPDDVRLQLERLPLLGPRFIIFDEFDRVENDDAITLMSDTIKALSDRHSSTRLVIVGVAKSLDALIGEHESIKRALREIMLPRMNDYEVQNFIQSGFDRVGIVLTEPAERAIIRAAEGQPHFAHLICLTAGEAVIQDDRSTLDGDDVQRAIENIVQTHALAAQYDRATKSTKSNALYRHVLAACALADKSPLGDFRAKDVEKPMSQIMGQRVEMAGFFRHLNAFTTIERGSVLTMEDRHYRFTDPQMQPFAFYAAIGSGVISQKLRDELLSAEPRLPFDQPI
jgi:Cdc6-like AAA superfamily ATPase